MIGSIKFRRKFRPNSLRLNGYDYSADGAYYITICTKNREHIFGEIINGKLTASKQAKICSDCWLDLSNHYSNCILDTFVIMPDHVHMIIIIQNNDNKRDNYAEDFRRRPCLAGAGFKPAPSASYSISEIIRGFKTFTARKINDWQNTPGEPFWQSRFYDCIIKNEHQLNCVRQYIIDNPVNWKHKNR